MRRFTMLVLALGLVACGDDDGGAADASTTDAALTDATVDAGQDADAGPCENEGALDDPCTGDCDCQTDLRCRGLPGAQACAVPCEEHQDCATALPGCNLATCEQTLGACRCQCEQGSCGDDVCFGSWCVGCARDADCAGHSCGSDPGLDTPRCDVETGTCGCGGDCGDGVCDPVEQADHSCPADCQTCTAGEALLASCSSGERVGWCDCVNGTWDCADPWDQCAGDTRCAREGGFCTAAAVDCMDGTISASPLECTGSTPLCCAPEPCTEAGDTYYPMSGRCCPGLRAITSLAPMTGMLPDQTGTTCYPGCWAMTCAPCGDGVCQLHFGENSCNCPEDCPTPPQGLTCSTTDLDCGRKFCRQEGTSCHQETPRCNAGTCTRDIQDIAGAVCDRITDTCVTP